MSRPLPRLRSHLRKPPRQAVSNVRHVADRTRTHRFRCSDHLMKIADWRKLPVSIANMAIQAFRISLLYSPPFAAASALAYRRKQGAPQLNFILSDFDVVIVHVFSERLYPWNLLYRLRLQKHGNRDGTSTADTCIEKVSHSIPNGCLTIYRFISGNLPLPCCFASWLSLPCAPFVSTRFDASGITYHRLLIPKRICYTAY